MSFIFVMLLLPVAWLGCSSTGGDQQPGSQTCKGSPGEEFCACSSSGGCNSGLTCAVELRQCVHLAGTPPASGGSKGTGGANPTGAGGTGQGTGGIIASGGSDGTGTGGGASTGGTGAVGGSASGGTTGSGGRAGNTGNGNSSGSGGTGGSSATGGATATSCGTLKPSASGNGEFTHYNFGMGTGMDSSSHMYLTACGYLGSESGGSIDTVMNIANTAPAKNTYFAAIPGKSSSDFNTNGSCGSCIQISNGGNMIIATIIDECPENSNPVCAQNPTGELDLSVDAFNALHFGNGNPKGTSWKVVPCPVSGNVAIRIKPGNQNEVFIANTVLALQSVSGPGGNASRTSYGSWHFNANLGSGSQLTLTDVANRMIQVTLTSGSMGQNQDGGKQFPACQ